MILYGRNPIREALAGPRRVRRLWVTRGAAREGWLATASVPLEVTEPAELLALCGSEAHQGVCAEVDAYRYVAPEHWWSLSQPLLVVLDQVQDPQNLGSICRSAECAGAAGVIIPERRAAEITPAACKASAGAVEHLAVGRVRNIADFLLEAKQHGLWCYGTERSAPQSYTAVDFSGGAVIVLGSEGRGLRPRVSAACDAVISLPVRGKVDSLGVAAAAAVLLYAATSA